MHHITPEAAQQIAQAAMTGNLLFRALADNGFGDVPIGTVMGMLDDFVTRAPTMSSEELSILINPPDGPSSHEGDFGISALLGVLIPAVTAIATTSIAAGVSASKGNAAAAAKATQQAGDAVDNAVQDVLALVDEIEQLSSGDFGLPTQGDADYMSDVPQDLGGVDHSLHHFGHDADLEMYPTIDEILNNNQG